MAGLIEKDIRLLLGRKQNIILILLLAIVLGLTQEGTFILGYLPFLGMLMTTGTIAYDELDNGFTFLMTLPIDAKTYVKEKYLFCLSGALISWFIAVILYFLSWQMRGEKIDLMNEIPLVASFIPIVILFMAIMIPIQLKFGAEKSRIVLLIIFGIIILVAFLIANMIGSETINQIYMKIDTMDVKDLAFGGILFVILATALSYKISCKIMKNKEL
ncbi:MAG: ABC-2 transporter permease [Clostridiales bacterium]|nr:ABC-2 transporter permease [Clostridiales bacterium]